VTYQIDSLDRQILERLQGDCRTPYLEIARDLGVSGGTIHQRLAKLKEAGVVTGARLVVDHRVLGYGVSAFVGIRLARASACPAVQEALLQVPEVVEIHYTTGTYSLLVKVVARGMDELYALLSGKLQSSDDVQSTETFLILNTVAVREPAL
jgi:Lrp/AsnC family transcriptional regulator for asnA, asnC and gidA